MHKVGWRLIKKAVVFAVLAVVSHRIESLAFRAFPTGFRGLVLLHIDALLDPLQKISNLLFGFFSHIRLLLKARTATRRFLEVINSAKRALPHCDHFDIRLLRFFLVTKWFVYDRLWSTHFNVGLRSLLSFVARIRLTQGSIRLYFEHFWTPVVLCCKYLKTFLPLLLIWLIVHSEMIFTLALLVETLSQV